jgi:uncharacterized protein with ParB-like and HNH nuclease domain
MHANTMNRLISVNYNSSPISSIQNDFRTLDLNPAFQRKSVWKLADRKMFIKTILEGMPCPTIFLFKRWDKKKKRVLSDVLDGKQRLETIFLFIGKLRPNEIQINSNNLNQNEIKKLKKWLTDNNYRTLPQENKEAFMRFNIPIGHIELKDESDGSGQGMSDIYEAFVRINTQGRPLTKQERRNAYYLNRPIFQLAKELNQKFLRIFTMSSDQQLRMKDIEIVLELLFTLNKDETLNKKAAIDLALSADGVAKNDLKKLKSRYIKICEIIRKMKLGQNLRFIRRTSDFYSLFVSVMRMEQNKKIFDGNSLRKAGQFLTEFSKEIAALSDAWQRKDHVHLRKLSGSTYYKYWLTTQSNTDSKRNRQERADILSEILIKAFKGEKDKNRFFSDHQKEVIWQNTKDKRCAFPTCKKVLSWENATIDHIVAWAHGGKTDIANGQLMCRKHNSMKGDRDFDKFLMPKKRRSA